MIISRTPFRVSLFGGGTDFPAWYREHGGAVIGFALDKYCYVSLRNLPPFFDYQHRIVYSKVETTHHIADIEHPAVRAVLTHHPIRGAEIHHDGDLPARSGLGSSSAFTVGLLNACLALVGRRCPKKELAERAIELEQNVMKEAVGSQDQIWAAYGGLNRIDFHPGDSWDVKPLILPPARRSELLDHLLLCFTGFSRIAAEIEAKKIAGLDQHRGDLAALNRLVDQAEAIICDPRVPISGLGTLLDASWRLKRGLAGGISNPEIDGLYEAGKRAGALGGKLLGAGAGGFMLFFCPPAARQSLLGALAGRITLSPGIDYSGSQIIVYEP